MRFIKACIAEKYSELPKLISLIFLFSLAPLFAYPNDVSIQSLITHKASLSKRPVVDMLEDSLGYLWFASPLDLSRYNGKTFQKYNNQQSSNLRINGDNIQSIHLRGRGDILIIYESQENFIDYLQLGKESAKKISIGEDNGIKGNRITLLVDEHGVIFCLTESAGVLNIYHSLPDWTFRLYTTLQIDKDAKKVDKMLKTREGKFWLSFSDGALCQFSADGALLHKSKPGIVSNISAQRLGQANKSILYEDKNDRLWYAPALAPGLFHYVENSDQFEPLAGIPGKVPYTHIWEDLVGNIMVGASYAPWQMDAIYRIDEAYRVHDYSGLTREYDKISGIYSRDFSRLMFVGTFIGLKKIIFKNPGIKNYLNQELQEGEWGWSIRGMAQTKEGHIYVAREQREWYRFDPGTEALQKIPFQVQKFNDDQVLRNSFSLIYDEAEKALWGTRRNGKEGYFLLRFDLTTEQFTAIASPNFIQSLGFGNDGRLWVGCGKSTTEGELYCYHKDLQQFQKFVDAKGLNPFKDTQVRYIFESTTGILWVGTRHGLFRIEKDRVNYKRYYAESSPFSNDNIVCIEENEKGELLLGTEGGGLNIFNPQEETVRIYTTNQGLANDLVSAIIPEGQGRYWLSTYGGVSYFYEEVQSFRNFFVDDGLSYNEFNRFSFLRDQDGRIYLGGMNGFNVIDPDQLLESRSAPMPELCLSKVVRYNPSRNEFITDVECLSKEKSITISPYDAYFQIDFFLPDYRHPDKNQYRYQLLGYDNSWNDLGNNNNIRYHDLPAANYQLVIDAKSPGGQWGNNTQLLKINVEEFFYKTKAAFFLYALSLGLLFAGAYRVYAKRKLEIAEARRLKELDEFKSRFYANISHEFRTPLTLISGPLDRAIQQLSSKNLNHILEDLQVVKRNSNRLLYLINRILDLSKLEAGKLETTFIYGDLKVLIKQIIHSFKSILKAKNIQLDFQVKMENFHIDMEKQLISHILINLLSNAVKFTPKDGKIMVRISESAEQWYLELLDNGRGIPDDQLEAIFDRFHTTKAQNALGTGIGLAFTKELVDLMHGKIEVANRFEGGAHFTVTLPLSRSLAYTKIEREPEPELEDINSPDIPDSMAFGQMTTDALQESIISNSTDNRELILIVEDEYDVARFIERCLQSDYRIIKAANGAIGIEKALESIPDLIVSDVMMPEKDGFELCHILKHDVRSSHIPIILLTAKAGLEHRLAGLERGADDYLAKPFYERELRLRIANLLKSRVQLRKFYSNGESEKEGTMPDPAIQAERDFIDKAKGIVEEHLLDNNFDIPTFCKFMGMSRTQLHRKITAITGQSASNFINLIRLEKAKELLLYSDQSISDIAYATGFTDPSYFSRTFSKFQQCNPTEFRQKSRS